MTGVLLALLAAFCFAIAAIPVRLATQHIRPVTVTVISMVSGGALGLVLVAILFRDQVSALPASTYGWFVLIAALQFPLGRLMNYTGVKLAGVARTAPLLGTQPLWGALFGVVLLKEGMSPLLALGVVAVTVGVMLVAREGAGS